MGLCVGVLVVQEVLAVAQEEQGVAEVWVVLHQPYLYMS